jgi:energy-coupling factor transporter ATP-binding protein EcfA2
MGRFTTTCASDKNDVNYTFKEIGFDIKLIREKIDNYEKQIESKSSSLSLSDELKLNDEIKFINKQWDWKEIRTISYKEFNYKYDETTTNKLKIQEKNFIFNMGSITRLTGERTPEFLKKFKYSFYDNSSHVLYLGSNFQIINKLFKEDDTYDYIIHSLNEEIFIIDSLKKHLKIMEQNFDDKFEYKKYMTKDIPILSVTSKKIVDIYKKYFQLETQEQKNSGLYNEEFYIESSFIKNEEYEDTRTEDTPIKIEEDTTDQAKLDYINNLTNLIGELEKEFEYEKTKQNINSELRDYFYLFDISIASLRKNIHNISPGTKRKIQVIIFLLSLKKGKDIYFILLDQPSNNLDRKALKTFIDLFETYISPTTRILMIDNNNSFSDLFSKEFKTKYNLNDYYFYFHKFYQNWYGIIEDKASNKLIIENDKQTYPKGNDIADVCALTTQQPIIELLFYSNKTLIFTGPSNCGKTYHLDKIINFIKKKESIIDDNDMLYIEQYPFQNNSKLTIKEYLRNNKIDDVKINDFMKLIEPRREIKNADVEISTLTVENKKRLLLFVLGKRNDFKFLFLDEPTNHLNTFSQDFLIDKLKQMNVCTILICNDYNFIKKLIKDKKRVYEIYQFDYLRKMTRIEIEDFKDITHEKIAFTVKNFYYNLLTNQTGNELQKNHSIFNIRKKLSQRIKIGNYQSDLNTVETPFPKSNNEYILKLDDITEPLKQFEFELQILDYICLLNDIYDKSIQIYKCNRSLHKELYRNFMFRNYKQLLEISNMFDQINIMVSSKTLISDVPLSTLPQVKLINQVNIYFLSTDKKNMFTTVSFNDFIDFLRNLISQKGGTKGTKQEEKQEKKQGKKQEKRHGKNKGQEKGKEEEPEEGEEGQEEGQEEGKEEEPEEGKGNKDKTTPIADSPTEGSSMKEILTHNFYKYNKKAEEKHNLIEKNKYCRRLCIMAFNNDITLVQNFINLFDKKQKLEDSINSSISEVTDFLEDEQEKLLGKKENIGYDFSLKSIVNISALTSKKTLDEFYIYVTRKDIYIDSDREEDRVYKENFFKKGRVNDKISNKLIEMFILKLNINYYLSWYSALYSYNSSKSWTQSESNFQVIDIDYIPIDGIRYCPTTLDETYSSDVQFATLKDKKDKKEKITFDDLIKVNSTKNKLFKFIDDLDEKNLKDIFAFLQNYLDLEK